MTIDKRDKGVILNMALNLVRQAQSLHDSNEAVKALIELEMQFVVAIAKVTISEQRFKETYDYETRL